jgi:hypothetical protein
MESTSDESWPAIIPGLVIISGVIQKQPHGMFASVLGKRSRFMELKITDSLVPCIVYYEPPKSDASVPKGAMYIRDDTVVTTLAHRKGLNVCNPPDEAAAHEDGDVVRTINDLDVVFDSNLELERWEKALNYAIKSNITSKKISLTAQPKLTLTQVVKCNLL